MLELKAEVHKSKVALFTIAKQGNSSNIYPFTFE
jgi:hypothetical protein